MRRKPYMKLVRASAVPGPKDLELATKAPHVKLDANSSVANGFSAIVLSCLQHLQSNRAAFLRNMDPEALHQMRVSMRRLSSAFLLFRPILRRSRKYRRLSTQFRRLTRMLGNARNLDVLSGLVEIDHPQRSQIERVQQESHARVAAELESRRFQRLFKKTVVWLLIGKWRRRASADVPLAGFAGWRIDKAWAQIGEDGTRLRTMSERKRHHLRLRIKELRYSLDFTRSLHRHSREQAKRFHAVLEALQDQLGSLNDLSVGRKLAALNGWSIESLVDDRLRTTMLEGAEEQLNELLALGPYWHAPAGD